MRAARALHGLILGLWCAACSTLVVPREEPGLDLVIKGNRSISRADLWRAIHETVAGFEESRFPKSMVDDAAFELERFYSSQGFAFARVAYDYEEVSERATKAVLTVEEGPRIELARVAFRGNKAVKGSDLRPLFTMAKGGILDTSDVDWFVQDRVESGDDRVERVYRERGYLDVVVAAPEIRIDLERRRATVDVWINEGIHYRLGTVEITGDVPFPEDELRRAYAQYLGLSYFERLSPEIQGRIEEYYADRGYADVRVTRAKRENQPDGKVALGFAVEAGELVHVGAIRVRGNAETRTSFIRSRLAVEPGDRYSRAKERASFARLYQTGLFQTVRLGLDGTEGTERDLDIDLVEAPSLEIYLEPGWGSYERLRVATGMREKNVLGTGKIAQASGSVSELDQNGRVSLIDPWFLGSDTSANLSLFGRLRQEPGFDREELGSGLELSRRLSRRLEVRTGYTFRKSAIDNVDVVLPPDESDDVDISSVHVSAAYDTRNVVFAPTTGSLSKLGIEYASAPIGSELEFVRVIGAQAYYHEFDPETSVGASLRTGWMTPIGDTDTIPLQERFYNGGENSVRSFQEDELGPKDSSANPLGGEAFTVFSIEARREIIGRWHVALFYDVGNVVSDHSDYFEFADIRTGIGAGIRYELPVGPVRLDGALNPNPQDDEDRGAIHFSVGMAF